MRAAKQILVAYDGSAAARRALAHAADLANPGDGIAVVHVIPYQAVSARLEPIGDKARAEQDQLLTAAQHQLGDRGLTAETIAAVGDVCAAILDTAERTGADVIVLGRRQRRHPNLRGSVTAKLVRYADRDVLIVHETGEPDRRATVHADGAQPL
jgi:nucleotide-binding universal stress UspA family protein